MTDIHTTLAARYDKAAPNWWQKLERLSYPAAFRELVAHHPDDISEMTVLDAGTGCGDFAIALLENHQPPKRLDLLDISADMLDTATDRISAYTEPTRLHQPLESLRPNQYDLIICAHVIEHCPDPIAALSTLRRALRPNGQLLLAVCKPHACTILLQLIWRHRAFRPHKVEQMLLSAGFSASEIHPFSTGVPARLSCGYLATT